MKKLARTLAAVAFAGASVVGMAPAAQANECQEPTDPGTLCPLQDKFCDYGSTLEQKFGVGWSCTQ